MAGMALDAKKSIAAAVQSYGSDLTARTPGVAKTWTVRAMAQPARARDLAAISLESGVDTSEATATVFQFKGGAAISPNDEVSYQGFWYRLGALIPTTVEGKLIKKAHVGVRREAV